MRKNVKKQLALRVLSTAVLMAMVSSIATAAFADTYDLNKGSVTVETRDDGYTYVTQENSKGSNGQPDTTGVTITSDGKQTSNTITVNTAENQTTNVTLENVHIQPDSEWSSDPAPIEITGKGNTNLELNGNNIVLSGNSEHAAIEKADKYGTGTLTIKDDVNNDGSEKKGTDKDTTGKLLAGGFDNSAGIGGGGTGDTADTSKITITGGDITAVGGYYGAGVGSGNGGDASNIRIEGNAHVTAFADDGAAIGAGYGGSSDVTITGHANVDAAGRCGAAIGLGNLGYQTTITISGDATVNAEGVDGTGAIGGGRNSGSKVTVNIKDNANVTAIADGVAIGNNGGGSSTTINITGGTVDAVAHCFNSKPAIGANSGSLNLTVNSSTGKTTINAYNSDDYSPIGTGYTNDITIPASADYDETGTSQLGESNAAVINFYRKATLKTSDFNCPKTLDPYATQIHKRYTLSDKGDLYKVVHNRKYMEEHPDIVDTSKLENSDLHDWQLVDKVAPTLEKDGYADYICNIDKCCQTRHVVLPKLTPEESGSVEMREVGVIFWDAAAQAAPAALQGKVLSADEQTATAEKAQVESLLADKANWKLAEDVGDLMIHPAADAAGTVYEQAVKASGCQYYVIANVTAQ
ncbi:hypothetical protein ACKXF7_03195 [Faecalibacterium sp. 7]|uniref:hypothetical protein n=1 Tax=Faecalibacterium sp. 7 TaxID=3402017 RepID=UPI003C2DD5D4